MITASKINSYTKKIEDYLKMREEKYCRLPETFCNDKVQQFEEKEEDSDHCPLYDYLKNDQSAFITMTGFSIANFDRLYAHSDDIFEFKGRGRKPPVQGKDVLILLLNYLKRYPKLEEMSLFFEIKVSTLSAILQRAINAASEQYYKLYVEDRPTRDPLPVNPAYPEVSYLLDVTVQPINTPICEFNDIKVWFSGKHHRYVIKSQVITNVNGVALLVHSGIQGSIHDMKLFEKTKEEVEQMMMKHPRDKNEYPNLKENEQYGLILADKGYISQIPYIATPIKKPKDELTTADYKYNAKVSAVRIKIENFFGRLKRRYCIMDAKYRGNRESYESIFKLCAALVNYEILYCKSPLVKQDQISYLQGEAQLITETETIATKKKNEKLRKKQIRLTRFLQGEEDSSQS